MTNSSQTHPITAQEALRLLEDSLSYFTEPTRTSEPVQPDLPRTYTYYEAA